MNEEKTGGGAYLNDDFTGGELVFPDLDIAIAPRPGLLVGFASNHEFVHAVPKAFEAEMSNFRIGGTADAAYCVVDTFRHLLTEQAARSHLECIARSLRPGGIYVLGLHLLPFGADKEDSDCWTQRRCETKVTVTVRLLRTDRRRRIEDVQVCLVARGRSKELRLQHAFQLRTYTPRQFRRLLDSVPSLELCDVYDFRYDIEQPSALNDETAYTVFILRRGLPS